MSTPELWALSSTSKLETESSLKDFTSESSTWNSQPAEDSSWTELKKTIEYLF